MSARRVAMESLIRCGEISRAQLAAMAGLSRSTVTEVVQELLDCGMVNELPVVLDGGRRGRPAVRLSLCASHGYFAGAGISEVRSSMVLTDLRGGVLAECSLPFSSSPDELSASICTCLRSLTREAGVDEKAVLGLGLAVPGIVDRDNGVCRLSAALGWRDVPIVEIVERAAGVPACIGNDANAIAVAQRLFGVAREIDDFACIMLGHRIGCAHYMDGRLYSGHGGSAGEIGHITVDPAGAYCRCGKRGCLDTVAGGQAIREAARAAELRCESVHELEQLAAEGDAQAIVLLRRAGEALGVAVASLIQINNPATVLFADLEGFGNGLFYTSTRQTIENNILPRFLSSTQIVFQPVEYSFLARGAASVAAQTYLIEHAGQPKRMVVR